MSMVMLKYIEFNKICFLHVKITLLVIDQQQGNILTEQELIECI